MRGTGWSEGPPLREARPTVLKERSVNPSGTRPHTCIQSFPFPTPEGMILGPDVVQKGDAQKRPRSSLIGRFCIRLKSSGMEVRLLVRRAYTLEVYCAAFWT